MRDQAIARGVVLIALRGVEEQLARARTEAERQRLAEQHSRLRALLPAQPGERQRPEEVRATPREHILALLRQAQGQFALARTEAERQAASDRIVSLESVFSGFSAP